MSEAEDGAGRDAPAVNALGQPVGPALPGWSARPRPDRVGMEGAWCRLAPVDPEAHAADLYRAYAADRDGGMWTYLPYGPFDDLDAFKIWLATNCQGFDPLFFAIERDGDGALGMASFLRIAPEIGAIEIGHISYAPALQRSRASTEAMYLMMRHAFDLGYRRLEWKCDSLNAASRRAAERLGFVYEGLFRQAVVVKGRSRDNAWYSIVDGEWPSRREALERWLAPENFDEDGRQRASLTALRGE